MIAILAVRHFREVARTKPGRITRGGTRTPALSLPVSSLHLTMPSPIARLLILSSLLAATHAQSLAQTNSGNLQFRTSKGLAVNVHNGVISVNNRHLYRLDEDVIIYTSKRNRLIENGGTAFLFLEIDGNPNLDRLYVFTVSANRVDSVANAISSELKDYDGDSYLEFGGSDLTEVPDSRDSMYYIPSCYYEIRDGRVVYDSSCTRKMDIKKNGIYLAHPLNAHGYCCKVIPKPAYQKTYIVVDTGIQTERIDGPANMRDTIGGTVLFQLNDNVPVSTTDTINKWYRIGLPVDLDAAQLRSSQIQKGSGIYANGVQVGIALETVKLRKVFQEGHKLMGELEGYTSMQNIKQATIAEKVISGIIRQHRSFDVADLEDFIDAFRFSLSMGDSYPKLSGYYLDEDPVCNDSRPLRMFLAFNGRMLAAIVHKRELDPTGLKKIKLHGGYSLTVLANQDPGFLNSFIQHFNNYIDTTR